MLISLVKKCHVGLTFGHYFTIHMSTYGMFTTISKYDLFGKLFWSHAIPS